LPLAAQESEDLKVLAEKAGNLDLKRRRRIALALSGSGLGSLSMQRLPLGTLLPANGNYV